MMRGSGGGWERTKRALTNLFYPGAVERSVDAHGSQELEPDRQRINNFPDLKWANKWAPASWPQFLGVDPGWTAIPFGPPGKWELGSNGD